MSSAHGSTGCVLGEVDEDEIFDIPWGERPLKKRHVAVKVGEEMTVSIEGQTFKITIQAPTTEKARLITSGLDHELWTETLMGNDIVKIYQRIPGRERLKHFPFMRLPLELREKIYNYTYSNTSELGPGIFPWQSKNKTSEIKILSKILREDLPLFEEYPKNTGLIFASRQTMREATRSLLTDKSFVFNSLRSMNVVVDSLTNGAFAFVTGITIKIFLAQDFQRKVSPKLKAYPTLPPLTFTMNPFLILRFEKKFPTWPSFKGTPLIEDLLTYNNLGEFALGVRGGQYPPKNMKLYQNRLVYSVHETRMMKIWAEQKRNDNQEKERVGMERLERAVQARIDLFERQNKKHERHGSDSTHLSPREPKKSKRGDDENAK